MVNSERIVVGKFVGVFGVKGWLKVKSFTEPSRNILSYKPWFVKTAQGVKVFEVDGSQDRPQGLVVHLAGVDDRNDALEIRGDIEVDRTQLPNLAADEFYWHQLIGLEVVSDYQGNEYPLGKVKGLMETGANDVLVVKASTLSVDDRERLIPYVPGQFISEVNVAEGVIRVDWDPEF